MRPRRQGWEIGTRFAAAGLVTAAITGGFGLVAASGERGYECRLPHCFSITKSMVTAVNAWGLKLAAGTEWHSWLAWATEGLLGICLFAAFLPRPLASWPRAPTWAALSLVGTGAATLLVGYWGEQGRGRGLPSCAYFGAMLALLVLGLGYSGLLKRIAGAPG
jgi:hypothetical protein